MTPERAVALNAEVRTERLVLEPLTGDHADALWAPLQSPVIYQWISSPRPPLDAMRERWRELESRWSPEGEAWLGWAVRCGGEYVGKMDANVDGREVATNVGYVFFPPFWRRGIATEAVRGLVAHFAGLGVTELWATVTVGNDASGRVLAKAGFVPTRVIPANDWIRGEPYDDQEYVRRAG